MYVEKYRWCTGTVQTLVVSSLLWTVRYLKIRNPTQKIIFFFFFKLDFVLIRTYLLLRVAKSSTRNANFSSPNFCCSLFSFLSQGLLQNFVEGNELLLVFHCHSVAKLFQPEHIFANRLVFQVRDN